MGETVEKIYCCDHDNNDNALAAAILANGNNRRDDWGGLPTNVVLSAEGQTQRLANVSCGSSNCLAIYSSLTVTITPAAAPAA